MFPAPAGMNRSFIRRTTRNPGVPRARGDEPLGMGASGWRNAVFPAPAGMNRMAFSRAAIRISVPRARGDEPTLGLFAQGMELCSPRPRG
ncbi:conserved hypothetical protein [Thiocapsa sp. KS1]|nr:conserved hypothetical protein [Thiocapsa sp. KS1]